MKSLSLHQQICKGMEKAS